MLHDVGDENPGDAYTLSRLRLEEILRVVRAVHPVPFELTFDDARSGTFEQGLPALESAGLRATLFATIDFIDRPGFMDRARLRRWLESGQNLGSHAVTHRPLSLMTEREARAELEDSRARLEDWVGSPVTSFAFPGGNDTSRLRALALDVGYERVYTSEPGFARAGDRVLPRFTVRPTTPVAAVTRLGDAAWSVPFVADALRYRLKRWLGAGTYRRVRRVIRGGAAPGEPAA
jgi:peptidoglycan/xylan/chitin deacetylase (PgdA/CDA1 family)